MNVPRGTMPNRIDVLVVGAGHAGCEAALAAARIGLETVLITIRRDGVAVMSCNPAIGGLGKSQIVREIDALGGEMGKAADAATIQYRRLNSSKGPAVRARRVQCDLGKYHQYMLRIIESCRNLYLLEGMVQRLLIDKNKVCGVELEDSTCLKSKVVVLTTGTFLRGVVHIGLESFEAGRLGDPPSVGITESLQSLGLKTGRMKTGTPARLRTSSLDLGNLEVQSSEGKRLSFSHEEGGTTLEQVNCYITRTNEKTHQIIRNSLSRSPLFTGVIKGTGPRYCPSIEDKVVRFPDRRSHQIFLEPMDMTQRVIYPNGVSTSLPRDVQEEMIHSIEGLELAEIVDYGYAIEYDFVPPKQLEPTLEVRGVSGLFLAGQINGTSGYEEAAGQGLIAGINAAFKVNGREQVILQRHEAYIGVMIDDLVTRGTNEPYRMFSSRAEFRLLLREDNASGRLARWADYVGLVDGEALKARKENMSRTEELVGLLRQTRYPKDEDGRRPTLEKHLSRPEVRIQDVVHLLSQSYSDEVLEQAEILVKYQGYILRQKHEASRLKEQEGKKIPQDIVYKEIPGLSSELAGKLSQIRPVSLGQASRIDGMTPAALMVLSIWVSKLSSVPRGKSHGL